MYVKRLKLYCFRNILEADISFKEGMNFFLGDNAQGKTNALEAIYLFARGKSFRGAADKELVTFGHEGYRIELSFAKTDRDEMLACAFSPKEKIRQRNGVYLSTQAELLGSFRAVLFSPDHLQMVKGAPQERRRFLDIAIAQCYPAYLKLYSRYLKILEERNALLKSLQKTGYCDETSLTVYSEEMARAAAEILFYRLEYTKRLAFHTAAIMQDISGGKEELSLFYESDVGRFDLSALPDKEEVLAAYHRVFTAHTAREGAFGSSLYGVHRDELSIVINGVSAREYASQGQQRSIVLSLKMAEGSIAKELCGENPVYLFDDVLSELDEGRRKYLLSGMKDCQFIVTGCEKSILGDYKDGVHFITVKDGVFQEA